MTVDRKKTPPKSNSPNALIVFVRYPEKGKVKTRLAEGTNKNFASGV